MAGGETKRPFLEGLRRQAEARFSAFANLSAPLTVPGHINSTFGEPKLTRLACS